jgi:hypothetical protein
VILGDRTTSHDIYKKQAEKRKRKRKSDIVIPGFTVA